MVRYLLAADLRNILGDRYGELGESISALVQLQEQLESARARLGGAPE